MTYELTFLLNEEAEISNIKALIVSLKGKITKEDKWGERTLSYSIKKNHVATFYNYSIEIEKENVNELKKKLNLNEKLIRYLLLIS